MRNRILLVFLLLILVLGTVVQATELTGRDIMVKVDNRDDGDTRKAKMVMTLINKVGDKRIREVVSYQKDYGKDTKAIMIFESPGDVKGTGYLSWEYDDEDKEDNRWLYMPALRKIRRISGSSNDDYFMGTDFTYDDMGDRNVDEDKHTLLREEELNGYQCWVIQSIPKEIDEGDYSKKISWIRQDIAMAIKTDYYNEYGLLKTYQAKDIVEIDGIWTPKQRLMVNKQDEHQTIIDMTELKFNVAMDDNLFRTSMLKRGNIRY
ncbi:outer membrane lipoprotein-sorting protein [Halocella sp. SP3-1]|uniref:outer membrane lipoprotein-sorting protein n=1 Tax=Halocella sp. SP3-1 TaxID=2382161 RepID=UPI000F760BBC|nr:outer membrane lipoprotein-sorting protein [Halocella sp. SP3-1]AZO95957.1 outer membrane lipoprotein-sorting protein [Halocella sp. SP3-1]